MKVIIKVLLLLLMVSVTLAFKSSSNKKVLFFGDSITYNGTSWEGAYINLIANYAKDAGIEDIDFIGSGIPGDRITDLYLRMENDVLSKKPDVVVVLIGVNDVWHKILSGTGTDFTKFGLFYNSIVSELQTKGIKVLVCTPTSIGEKNDFSNECDGDMNKYSQWIRDYAAQKELPLVDLRKAFLTYNLVHNKGNKEKGILTADGVHLKPKGSKLVAKEIWKLLENEIN